MAHVIPLFVGIICLFILVFVGRHLIVQYRASIHDGVASSSEAVHSMMANLQRSLDRGEISFTEYRSVKTELMAKIQEQAENRNK